MSDKYEHTIRVIREDSQIIACAECETTKDLVFVPAELNGNICYYIVSCKKEACREAISNYTVYKRGPKELAEEIVGVAERFGLKG